MSKSDDELRAWFRDNPISDEDIARAIRTVLGRMDKKIPAKSSVESKLLERIRFYAVRDRWPLDRILKALDTVDWKQEIVFLWDRVDNYIAVDEYDTAYDCEVFLPFLLGEINPEVKIPKSSASAYKKGSSVSDHSDSKQTVDWLELPDPLLYQEDWD